MKLWKINITKLDLKAIDMRIDDTFITSLQRKRANVSDYLEYSKKGFKI